MDGGAITCKEINGENMHWQRLHTLQTAVDLLPLSPALNINTRPRH